MQISESEEGPAAHKSLIHLGKLIQVWVYIGKNQKQKKKWNSTVEYLNAKNKLSNKEKGVISEFVLPTKTSKHDH